MSNSPPTPLWIANFPTPAAATLPVVDPWTGAEFACAALGGPAEIESALAAAQSALPGLRGQRAFERAEILLAIARGIAARQAEFASLVMREAGKPIAYAEAEVQRAVTTFTAAAEEARKTSGELLDLDAFASGAGCIGLARRFPVGVIAAVTPFNFPLNLVAHKVAPCLATGNSMVVKLALKTPLTGLLLGEVLAASGVPAGQVSFITCPNADVSALVTDPRVKMLSFTGSSTVGLALKAQCLHRVTLELGGNAGVILHADADLPAAIPAVATGAFAFAGQSCISVQRVAIHDSRYEEARARLVAEIRGRIFAGDPRERRTVIGPMIEPAALQRIRERIGAALAGGGKLVHGGSVTGPCLEATVLEDVSPSCALCAEEAFAPIVTLHRYRDFDEALALINDSEFGLQAGVYTRDLALAWRAFKTLEVGGVMINQVPTFRVENMPYGGVKSSGFGREGVRYAMEEMTELKSLIVCHPP